jgi:hypothetical protein
LFPLSGKSIDLVHCYNEGHTVVGIEGVPLAVEEMFNSGNLEYTRQFCTEIDGFIYKVISTFHLEISTCNCFFINVLYSKKHFNLQTEDGRLTVYACDFFKMKPGLLEVKCDAVFDRGSFEAIYETDREAYINLILNLLSQDFRYILNVYEYQDPVFKGPPRSADRNQVLKLFTGRKVHGKETKAKILSQDDYSDYGKTRYNIQGDMVKFIYQIDVP